MTRDDTVAIGLDFGTLSVRGIAVETLTGKKIAESVFTYPHGVISKTLPVGVNLEADSAYQHVLDYQKGLIDVLRGVADELRGKQVVGIGVDFTACTVLPVDEAGKPLMLDPRFETNPHAWVKLWKHHAATDETKRINDIARQRDEPFLKFTGGSVFNEWMLPKIYETARKSPEVYDGAASFVEAGDWITFLLTGEKIRNACAAGYKGHWTGEEEGESIFSEEFLHAVDPILVGVERKWWSPVVAPGIKVGELCESIALEVGLPAGISVSAATIDAHSGVAGMGISKPHTMGIILGTSACHLVMSKDLKLFNDYAGVAKGGILPGYWGYESGQSAVGDIYGWFVKTFLNETDEGFARLSEKAAETGPGANGLIALDWMNGNRSVLMNADLSGLILGLTLETKDFEVYRALIEATAFGTRKIIESYEQGGIPIENVVVCGGLVKEPLILQIFADVTQKEIRVAQSNQAVALGAAIFGATAAGLKNGGFDDVGEAINLMTNPAVSVYQPTENSKAYDRLYSSYLKLHDWFGVHQKDLMKELKDYGKGNTYV